MNKDIEQLENLKEKLDSKEMSVLVGAGFSKNVSSFFPTWNELLHDMTYYLFEDEIKDAYKESLAITKEDETNDKSTFISNKVNVLINKIGFLDIVSAYIKRKGYRESITAYIEEKTPKVIETNEAQFIENRLSGKDNRIEITDNMLSQHKTLLQLPWNNIYTTNYDEMLETAIDSSIVSKIEEEIKSIYKEIEKLHEEEINRSQGNENLEDPEFENLSRDGIEFQLIDKNKNIKLLKKTLNESLTLVTDSSQLSIKRNKNIIKLHGTIRKNNSSFGFDGDIKKHYVISREDYETYPLKHEAFTQLMRISLLQESYCLIGFSGDDTNFIEWIKWVRDILERKGKVNNKRDYKIYLIDINKDDIDKDKLLFFENHKVYRIPIMKDHIISFLESKTESIITDRKKTKEVIELFLRFLTGGLSFNSLKTTYEILKQNKYKKLWDSINVSNPKDVDINEIIRNSDEIFKLRNYNHFPSLHFAYSNKKHTLLFFSNQLLKKAKNKKSTLQLLNLIITAIKDTFLSTGFVWNNDDFNEIYNKAKNYTEIKTVFDFLRLRQATLDLDLKSFKLVAGKNKNDNITYESILLSAFSFDFKKLKEKLHKWSPSQDWLLKKAGLLTFFNINDAKKIVWEHYTYSENVISQEQLITLQLYNYIKHNIDFRFDKELSDKIQQYKNAGLKDIDENLDIIIGDIGKKKGKLEPYGQGRFAISNGFSYSNDFTKPQKGLQFIQILIESGFPLCLPGVHLKSHELWYPVFLTVFEYYPYPSLFYSLQYSDQKFLKRIGQDFVYSEALKDDLKKILQILLNSYLQKETPISYKKSILSFCTELLIAVDPSIWEKFFKKIWKTDSFVLNAFSELRSEEFLFLNAASPYLQNVRNIRMIIDEALTKPKLDISIDYTYYLSNNITIENKRESLQTVILSKKINDLIEDLFTNEKAFFILDNLHSILTKNQQERIKNIIEQLDFNKIKDERLWQLFLTQSLTDTKTIKSIKSAIIKNEKLWDVGFTPQGLSSFNSNIYINKLRRTKNNPYGLNWNRLEAKKIYLKLKKELFKIENWLKKRPKHSFKFILQEMILFLEYEKSNLKNISDFDSVYERTKNIYYNDRGYNNLVSGISSSDSNKVIWALSELSEIIHESNSFDKCEIEISILINKILIQATPSLEACIRYLSVFIRNKNLTELFKPHIEILKMILDKYYEQELLECDKPFVQKQLINIAIKLNEWGVKDKIIDLWIEKKENTRFNNIKFQRLN